MKIIGLLGGMSWESTATYYRLINQGISDRLGGYHSAKIIVYSVDFAEIESLQRLGEWDKAGQLLRIFATKIEAAGADFLVICTNTMHKVMAQIQDGIKIPILSVTEAVSFALKARGLKKVGLLGTSFTMHDGFYEKLLASEGLKIIIPNDKNSKTVHRIIFEELVQGRIETKSRDQYVAIVKELYTEGAEGVILGCTEIGLLIKQADVDIPLFDTTVIHANAAIDFAFKN